MKQLRSFTAIFVFMIVILTACGQDAGPVPIPTAPPAPTTTAPAMTPESTPMDQTPAAAPTERMIDVSNYSILGAWKQTFGSSGWASSNGRIVQFNDSHQCNIFSPQDTFGISDRGGGGFTLSVTGLLGGNLTYWVKVIDDNHIDVYESNQQTLAFQFSRLE